MKTTRKGPTSQRNDPTISSRALRVVKKFFPNVEKVIDATTPINIEVSKADNSGRRYDHAKCALAVACERTQHADGAIISIGSAYVIKGKTAIRYRVPQSVSREVTSFDRAAGFEPGVYSLAVPAPSSRIGASRRKPTGPKLRHTRHQTGGIRTTL